MHSSVVGVLVGLLVVAALPHRSPARPWSRSRSVGDVPTTDRPVIGSRMGRRTGLLAVVVTIAFAGGPFAAALAAAVLAARRPVRRVAGARAQRQAVERELPDVVDLFVVAVHSGLTPRQAIVELVTHAPPAVRPACAAVVAAMERGEPLADAVDALTTECGPPAVPLVDAIRSTERAGLSLAAALESLAVDNRLIRRRLDEAAARRLPVTLSFPLVTCTLPSFVLLAVVPMVMAAISSLGAQPW